MIFKWYVEYCWDCLEINVKFFLLNILGLNLRYTVRILYEGLEYYIYVILRGL